MALPVAGGRKDHQSLPRGSFATFQLCVEVESSSVESGRGYRQSENEMSKPESERGKSPFSKVWGAAFAMQGMATQNTLNEIADDVGDISDGGSSGGFE